MPKIVWKWGPALGFFLIVLGFALRFHYQAPFHDHWDIVPLYAAWQNKELAFRDLFALHGNHWHASGYLVQLALSPWTKMAHWAEVLASVSIAGLGFVALARLIDRAGKRLDLSQATAWAMGLAAFLFFSLDQAANWLWGWQVAVFISLAGALWTIERLTHEVPSVRNTLLAASAAALAIYAFGTSWVLLPIGFVLLFAQGAGRSLTGWACLGLWSILSMLLFWHFSLAMNAPAAAYSAAGMPALDRVETWLGLAHYTINFTASPVVRFARDSAELGAALGLGLSIWAVWTLRKSSRPEVWRAILPFLALAAYSFGAGLLTAFGRWAVFGVNQAFVSRYISFGTLFWIAVFVLAVFAIAKTQPRTPRAAYAMLGLFVLLKLGNIPSVVQKSVAISNDVSEAAHALRVSYPETDPATYQVLHQIGQPIDSHLSVLAAHRASLFAEPVDQGHPAHVDIQESN
ncbi:MAG: hypothetical protein NXH72_01130 [Hyphomonadaceae bacterium]|nr:hypothetical protein [Hyphomonadaceae bacterium]